MRGAQFERHLLFGTTMKFTLHEAKTAQPGNAAMLGRLTELMFVEILRQYMQQVPADHGGWLAGLNDVHVGKALRLMHAKPAQNWTVAELARAIQDRVAKARKKQQENADKTDAAAVEAA